MLAAIIQFVTLYAIETYEPNNNRSELKKIGLHQVVLDAYNANPSSMEVAIKHFSNLSHPALKNKIVILGDMFELGETAHEEPIIATSSPSLILKLIPFNTCKEEDPILYDLWRFFICLLIMCLY